MIKSVPPAMSEGTNQESKSPLVQPDKSYLKNEKELLKDFITKEAQNQEVDLKHTFIKSVFIKRNILNLIFAILSAICVILYAMNVNIIFCAFIQIVVIFLYIKFFKKISIYNDISKILKKNPDEEISKIMLDIKNGRNANAFSSFLELLAVFIVIVAIPIFVFRAPKLIYTKYDTGYSVKKYTTGIIKTDDRVVIPESYKNESVISIDEAAFKNSTIKEVILPNTLTSIKTKAFYNCAFLESIEIPSSVTELRASCFEECSNLNTVKLNEGLIDIRANVFKADKKLVNVELPTTLEYLGAGVFSYCSSLTKITIPNKVIEINGNTFEYCSSLTTVNLNDNIISIHGEVFVDDYNLESIVLPSKITEIKGNTFDGCSKLKTVAIPYGVTRIAAHAFSGCSKLESVEVPSTVTEVGSSAFRECLSLKTIKIPKAAVVADNAFKESSTIITRF